jgi:riboflavin biosynthesis pyrimidine reductase
VLTPFDVLFEAALPSYPLPEELTQLYGRLGFADHAVYSNFVSSLDGVVSLGAGVSAGSVISAKHPADRFLMALLRACADAVVVGAGTMRATPGHLWTPAHVFPDLAPAFTALRAALGRAPEPRLVLLTATGDIDVDHPALRNNATVITTKKGADRIGDRLPSACEVVVPGKGKKLDVKIAFDEIARMRYNVVLTEGGPHLMGQMIKAELLDEMFLTVSPVVAGRRKERRLGMVEGVELLPSNPTWSSLLSVRRNEDYLFLRYGVRRH